MPNVSKWYETKSCIVCSKLHLIAYCYVFKGKFSKDKLEFVKIYKLCFKYHDQHHVGDCKTQKTCLICAAKHHALLHESLQPSNSSSSSELKSQQVNQSSEIVEKILWYSLLLSLLAPTTRMQLITIVSC